MNKTNAHAIMRFMPNKATSRQTVSICPHQIRAWVGSIAGASGSAADFTALGDKVNIASRLASKAGPGEVLLSEAAYNAAHLKIAGLESRVMELKGKSEPVTVMVMQAG